MGAPRAPGDTTTASASTLSLADKKKLLWGAKKKVEQPDVSHSHEEATAPIQVSAGITLLPPSMDGFAHSRMRHSCCTCLILHMPHLASHEGATAPIQVGAASRPYTPNALPRLVCYPGSWKAVIWSSVWPRIIHSSSSECERVLHLGVMRFGVEWHLEMYGQLVHSIPTRVQAYANGPEVVSLNVLGFVCPTYVRHAVQDVEGTDVSADSGQCSIATAHQES